MTTSTRSFALKSLDRSKTRRLRSSRRFCALDEAAGNASTAVDVIPVQGVSPSVLEQALIVLQQSGATTTRSANGTSTRNSGRGTTSGRGGR